MNRTNLEHAVVAMIFTLVGAFLGNAWIGCAFAIGVFSGREHAQREYKIGDPSNLVGYEALDFWRWKLDAQLDLLFPIASAVVVANVAEWIGGN